MSWGTSISFNLVIENLIFSTLGKIINGRLLEFCFNLVIENLIFSTRISRLCRCVNISLFQSRNRESYLFNWPMPCWMRDRLHTFQSRNRESYLFNTGVDTTDQCGSPAGFNLVIENLIFSTWRRSASWHKYYSFNLVIENLIFSTNTRRPSPARISSFQSRNRESYLFNWKPTPKGSEKARVSIS